MHRILSKQIIRIYENIKLMKWHKRLTSARFKKSSQISTNQMYK